MLGSTSSAPPLDTGVDPDQTTFDRVSDMGRSQPAPLSVDAMSDSDMDEAPRLAPAASPQNVPTRLYQGRGTSSASSSHFVIVIPPPEMPTTTLPRSASAPTLARRGTLLPLYPTLGGQLYAIAREYGLPSVGGISLYLVDDGSGNDGPRIGDSTWAALWSGFFDEDLEPPALPVPDLSDSESYVRPTPLPYMRKSPRPRQLSHRESSRRLPRMASNASLASTRSASAASFTLETGRLPIVGKFEWSVDPVKAKWWRPFMAHAEAVAEMASPQNSRDTDAPPLPTPRTSGHRPLHLATMATPSPVRSHTLPAAPNAPVPSARAESRDSIVPTQLHVQTRDAPIIAASPGPSPVGASEVGQEVLVAPPSVPDILSPPSSAPDMQTAPTSLSEAPPPFEAPAPGVLGSPMAQRSKAPAPPAWDNDTPRDASQPADEPLTPLPSSPPPLPTRASTTQEPEEESKKRNTMSGAVASLSAAASRLFGGHRSNEHAAQDAETTKETEAAPDAEAPQDTATKPQTPTSPQHNVEEARELLTERERKTAHARRHMQRASIDIPRSVKRASARMSQAMGGLPNQESWLDEDTAKSHKRSTSTPHVDSFEFPPQETRPVPPPPAPVDREAAHDEASEPVPAPSSATLPASRFLPTSQPESQALEEHWVTRQSLRRPLEEAPRSLTDKPPTHDILAQRLGREGSLRSPILLDQNLPNISASSPVLASKAPISSEALVPENGSTQDMVPEVPSASKLSRQDTIDFNNTLGDLQRALDLLSPRHSSQKRRTRYGMRSSTATEDSVIPTVDDSQSSTTPAYLRSHASDASQDDSLSMPGPRAAEAPVPTQAAPLATTVAQDLSTSLPRWDPPVNETSAWSAEPTPVATSQQWGEGPKPTWHTDSMAPTMRPMDSVPWPRDSVQSQSSWSRSSMPQGGDEVQTRDSQSLLSTQLPRPLPTASTEPPMRSNSANETAVPEEAAAASATDPSPAAPAAAAPPSSLLLDVTVPPHDGAWSVRWDLPSTEQPPPPPPPKDDEVSQTQWMTSPSVAQAESLPVSSQDASMQLESVLAQWRPRDTPTTAPAQSDEWMAWSGASIAAPAWPPSDVPARMDAPINAANTAGSAPSLPPMPEAVPTAESWAPPLVMEPPSAISSATQSLPSPTIDSREAKPSSAALQAPAVPPPPGGGNGAAPLNAWNVDRSALPTELSSGRLTPPNEGPLPVSTMSPISPGSPHWQAPLPRTSSHQDLHRLSTSPPPKGNHFLSKMSPKFKWPRRKREEKRQTPMQVSAPIQGGVSDEDISHPSLQAVASVPSQGPPALDASTPTMPSPSVWEGPVPQAMPSSPSQANVSLPPTHVPAQALSPLMPNEDRTSVSTSHPSFVFEEPPRRMDVANSTEPSASLSDMYRASIDGKNAGPVQDV